MPPHCHAAFASGNSLLITLFLGALIGSLTHCSGMCGPFVLAQVSGFAAPSGKDPAKWYRALLLPYHLGRLTTYTLLGVLATSLSLPLLDSPALHLIAPLMLVVAGVIFLLSAFSELLPAKTSWINFSFCAMPAWIRQGIASLLPHHSLFSGYVLGVVLGFLPCGLVYAAILAVAATGNILQAFMGMIAFALGTMPVLMVIGVSGKIMHQRFYIWIKPLSALVMALNSMALFMMAGKGFL